MWVIGIILLLAVIAGIVIFNRLVRARNMVNEAWSGIDVQLRRRHDLVPNLVEAVEGYSKHERTLFEEITQTRVESLKAESAKARGEAETTLTGQLKTLFAVAEAYPDLKASSNFIELQKGLVEIEDQIQYARRYYNGAVRDYNIIAESFPSNLLANTFGFRKREFFEIEFATERQAPEVAFQSSN